MTFGREHEMALPVGNWLRRHGMQVKPEFAVPWGICDFVAVSLNATKVRKRLEFGQINAIGPLWRVSLLQHIPDKETGRSITQSKLERLCGAPPEFTGKELEKLIADRFVRRTARLSLQKLNGWFPLHNRIVAVELKLSRVSDALAQASCNRAFATESFIAIPTETALRILSGPRRADFVNAGVGILGVTQTRCKVMLKPSARGIQADPTLQMHCVERFWRTKDSST